MQALIDKMSSKLDVVYPVGLWISFAALIIFLIAIHISMGFSSCSFHCDLVAIFGIALPLIMLWIIEYFSNKATEPLKALYIFQATVQLSISIYFLITDHLECSRDYIGNLFLGMVLLVFSLPWIIGVLVYITI